MVFRSTTAGFRGRFGAVIYTGVLAAHCLTALAAEDAGEPAATANTGTAQPAVLRGRVTSEKGEPLADVRVCVAVPAAPMHLIDRDPEHRVLETRTDADGGFRLEVGDVDDTMSASVDAMKPGYERLSGALFYGGDRREFELTAGKETKASFVLKPALYFRGVVVDEQGKPIPGVEIGGCASIPGTLVAGIEATRTQWDGTFELFNYPFKLDKGRLAGARGSVYIGHPDYIESSIPDVYELPEGDRQTIRIALSSGVRLSGQLLDLVGEPAPGVLVKAYSGAKQNRKAAMTDNGGRFVLPALEPGVVELRAEPFDRNQKVRRKFKLAADRDGLVVRLKPIDLPPDLRSVR